MTTIYDQPEDFATSALEGYASVYGRFVRAVKSGVVRSTPRPEGKVAVVVGGGSGHYPAFAGYVGSGLADAAVAGDVFASPSTAGVARVCRLAHRGGGILLGYGNYAGDVLNFGAAAERLRSEGLDVRVLPVTDDVASGPADDHLARRGIAGDLIVFKIAGAAAEEGRVLDDVEAVAKHANARTVSFGVAFGGCTLPGSDEPLFTVPKAQMALGLGIHGEPGISETAILPASALADLLTHRLLAERPADCHRVAVLLNGLGATKYEELFVLWPQIAARLSAARLEIVRPEVGEFVTSLDMRGCSLSLLWLDNELERLWCAPCETAVLVRRDDHVLADVLPEEVEDILVFPHASDAARVAGRCIATLIERLTDVLHAAEAELGRIDAQAGDGDHGQGMTRGATAARSAADAAVAAGAGAQSVLAAAADAWADRAGGTSGVIWGVLLRAWSTALSDDKALDDAAVIAGARLALDGVMRLGGAKIGDKTLVDAFVPFVETLEMVFGETRSLQQAWTRAAAAATTAAEQTRALTPRLGRARPLAERSIGHRDAGAVSLALCAETVAAALHDPRP
ncbi:dihydroxyacetone kinase [Rhizobium sp. Leaf384]|uniref:dihydroxyacetone kinase family protein n=1 Tax=unclassified Rhizobium TaxID=2613769 RepID=UPI000714563C|nr:MULTISPECIES: dihydroxyacetone kinase family protein [unclassified Rhizobium]KQS75668.1 dihydroxyacetone kinase [Rhizobium sp. Leaf384]KQS75917.1 dihydroxyacetone kinase [Rhizobium sp. Leaf383]